MYSLLVLLSFHDASQTTELRIVTTIMFDKLSAHWCGLLRDISLKLLPANQTP